jgi:hypothetical protein
VTFSGAGTSAAKLIEDDDWFGFVSGDGDQDGVVDAGTHTWTIRATDALGNVGTLSGTMELSLDTIDC